MTDLKYFQKSALQMFYEELNDFNMLVRPQGKHNALCTVTMNVNITNRM